MIPIIDFQERSLTGPVMKADDFDLSLSMKIRELVKKYDIRYRPDQLIVDDNTADAVFNAGVDLLADIGLYHLGTQRVIRFSKEEILGFVTERMNNPGKATFGLDDDEMTIAYRRGTDKEPPTLYVGAAGAIEEEDFIPLMVSFARERKIKGMGISGGIAKVGDVEPKAGTLSEIYCGLWEQARLKEVLDIVGRPGMNLGLLCTVSTLGATIQCIDGKFRGPHNTQIGVHVIPEQKIDWDRLLLALFCENRGIVPWQSAMSLIGGLCRDAADAAVGLVANMLAHMSYAHGPMCSVFPTNLDGTWATRPTIWAASAAMRASERNIRLAIGSGVVHSYQWGATRAGILQEAVMALVYTASGFSYAWLGGPPIETILIDEMMNMAVHMAKGEIEALANVIMQRFDELCEEEQPRQSLITFRDVYDIETITPRPEYEHIFNRAKEELIRLGLPLA